MVSFTHAYPTSYWLHFHLWTGVSCPSYWDWLLLSVSSADDESVRQVTGPPLWKLEQYSRDVTMHRDTNMRVKGWKGRRSDHSCSESDNRVSVLSVYLSGYPPPKGLSCFNVRCKLVAALWKPGILCLLLNSLWSQRRVSRGLSPTVWIKWTLKAPWPSGGPNLTFME